MTADLSADSSDPTTPTLIPLPDVAAAMGLIVTKVHQLLLQRQLIAIRVDGIPVLPAEFLDGSEVVKGLPGTITLLTDAGYSDEEIIRWLFTADDSLPGTPMQALRENRGREVRRRAQSAGF